VRNFILFIRRFFNLILFLGLEIVCLILTARTNTLQGGDIVSSANLVAGTVYKKQSDVVYYFGLRKMNDSLLNENQRLRQELTRLHTLDTLKDSTVHKALAASDSSKHIVRYADYTYRTARVINNSVNATDNYITIDRGSADGVARYMAVISGTGIVGRVEHVSAHFASVLSVLSSKQRVSAKLKDNMIGYILWDERQPDVLVLTEVPQSEKVKKGDSVFTTGYSFFPADILIGTVTKTTQVKKNNLQLIYLQPSTNYRSLQYVYVVSNKMEVERKRLEEDSSSNKKH
jgi:rod shape-determining protein MreC